MKDLVYKRERDYIKKQAPEGEFIPTRAMVKFLQWFVEELDPTELKRFDLNTLALRAGLNPRKVKNWFKNPEFVQWFYENVDETFKLWARVLAKQLMHKAMQNEASDKEIMFLIKIFLQPPRIYKHEYQSVSLTINQAQDNKKEIYDYEIVNESNSNAKDNMVSE